MSKSGQLCASQQGADIFIQAIMCINIDLYFSVNCAQIVPILTKVLYLLPPRFTITYIYTRGKNKKVYIELIDPVY